MTAPRWPTGLSMPGDETTPDAAPAPRPAAQAASRGIAPHPAAPSRPGPSQEAVEPGSYRPPAEVTAATADYRQAEDRLGQWIAERCLTGPNKQATGTDLYEDFCRWAEGRREWTPSAKWNRALGRRAGRCGSIGSISPCSARI